MRDELMTEAMCWDTDNTVPADFAHSWPNLSYFCPHPGCLAAVHAKTRKNTYFVAPDKHATGCPNEAREVESKGTALEPKKKKSIVPPRPIPTELGPGSRPARKRRKPTHADLLALASSLTGRPPECAGTLDEVVAAYTALSAPARAGHALRIGTTSYTYQTAFYFLAAASGLPVTAVPFSSKIIHGAAHVSYDARAKCYWVESAKKFPNASGKSVALVIRAPEGSPAGSYIKSFLPPSSTSCDCTLFYSSGPPTLSSSGLSYMLSNDISDKYWRFVLHS